MMIKKEQTKFIPNGKQIEGIFLKKRETWHSYQSDGVNNRMVLVYNLMTRRIRQVYQIEKKNYFWEI